MERITASLEAHHKSCDQQFALVEEAVSQQKWDEAMRLQTLFADQLNSHFLTEEQTLFPAFENKTGMSSGPTQVMRMEHTQMRGLLEELDKALQQRDQDEFLGCSETLLMLMQQHNMKEENILYPMCDQALTMGSPGLGQTIRSGLVEP